MTDDGCHLLPTSVPRFPATSSPSILRALLDRNEPFLLTDATRHWRATQAWVVPGEEAEFVSMDLLEAAFRGGGDVKVPVVECGAGGGGSSSSSSSTTSSYGEEPRRECTLREYAALWRSGEAEAKGLYLKDWHIVRALHSLPATQEEEQGNKPDSSSHSSSYYYAVPAPLNDDWLNGWWDAPPSEASHVDRDDDYRFLYLGPKGSTTGLHHDVLCSYSWSANVAGRKEWTLFPPDATPLLYTDAAQTTLRSSADIIHEQRVPHLVLEQQPGEIIFVPSGWHHTVTNLTGCLSINHNWFNRSCLPRVWAFLQKEAAAVHARLAHLKETFDDQVSGWERQCEVVLRANSALNLTEFTDLLLFKAHRVLRLAAAARQEKNREEEDEDDAEEKERRKDLLAIHAVLRELAMPPHIQCLFPLQLLLLLQQQQLKVAMEDKEPPPSLTEETFRPQVQAWLAAETKKVEEEIDWKGGGHVEQSTQSHVE